MNDPWIPRIVTGGIVAIALFALAGAVFMPHPPQWLEVVVVGCLTGLGVIFTPGPLHPLPSEPPAATAESHTLST
jgi:hypothetical protein